MKAQVFRDFISYNVDELRKIKKYYIDEDAEDEEVIKSLCRYWLRDVDHYQCASETLRKAMRYQEGKVQIDPQWIRYDRHAERNKWSVGVCTGRGEDKEYEHVAYAKYLVGEERIALYETKEDFNNGIEYEIGTDPHYYSTRIGKLKRRVEVDWPHYRDTYSSIQCNHMIADFLEHFFDKAVQMETKVYWLYDREITINDIKGVKRLANILYFPPMHTPETVASLWEVIKEELEEKLKVVKEELGKDISEVDDDSWEQEKQAEKIAAYRKDIEIYAPLFSGISEFADVANELQTLSRQTEYRNIVLDEADVFGDIVNL